MINIAVKEILRLLYVVAVAVAVPYVMNGFIFGEFGFSSKFDLLVAVSFGLLLYSGFQVYETVRRKSGAEVNGEDVD